MGKYFNFAGLLLAEALGSSVYSILPPYLPDEAGLKNISSTMTGVLLSGYPLAAFLSSLVLGKYIRVIGKKRVLLLGCSFSSIATLAYGFLPNFSYYTFITFGFSFRLLQGLGAGFIGTSVYAIVISEFDEKLEKYLGMLRISDAVGFMAGPLGASGLHSIGGFSAIFFTYGALFILLVPVIYLVLNDDKPMPTKAESNLTAFTLLKSPSILLNAIVILSSATSLCFISPTYSKHLSHFNIPSNYYGAIFAIPTSSYVLTIVYINKSTLPKRVLVIIGVFLLIVCNFIIGPWKYVFLPHEFYISCIAIIILGSGVSICALTAIPVMIENSKNEFLGYPSDLISDIISGIANSVYYLAEIYSPPLSGALSDLYGFENAQATLGGVLIIIFIWLLRSDQSKPGIVKETMELTEIKESLNS